jgi:hypothetical protein
MLSGTDDIWPSIFWDISLSMFSRSSYVVTCNKILFLFNITLHVDTTFYLFIQWYLGCFYLLVIVNNAAINIQIFLLVLAFFFCIYPEVELLDQMIILCLSFFSNCHTVFHSICIILQSHQQNRKALVSPHPHWHVLLSVFLNSKCSSECEEELHYGFHMHFANDKWCWSNFQMFTAYFYNLFL